MTNMTTTLTQCSNCLHWQTRGGAVFPARVDCTVFEDCGLAARVEMIVKVMAIRLSSVLSCPHHTPPQEDQPDAYRALDLVAEDAT